MGRLRPAAPGRNVPAWVLREMADILIVDHDEDLPDLLAELLGELGHRVSVARNGREGLGALASGLPDAIILDIEMPLLDGPSMAHEMFLADAGKERIPIVLISGYVDLPAIAARIATPYFAPKPCSLDTLVGLLDRALAERVAPSPVARTGPRARPSRPRGTVAGRPPLGRGKNGRAGAFERARGRNDEREE